MGYWAQSGAAAENVLANQYSNGQATEIQIVKPVTQAGGDVDVWVGESLTGSSEFIQFGYTWHAGDTSGFAHPLAAALSPSGACSPAPYFCAYWPSTNLAVGSWHQFWMASYADNVPTKWGYYLDSWSSRYTTFSTTVDTSGAQAPAAILEIADATDTLGANDVLGPTEFHPALQVYFRPSNLWVQPQHATFLPGYSYTCTQMGISVIGFNDDKVGGNVCPGPSFGAYLW